MRLSNRLAHSAWTPIVFALMCGCGGDDDGSTTGTLGTGGAGGSVTTGTGGAAGTAGATSGGAAGSSAGGASGTGGSGGAAGATGGAGSGGSAGSAGKGGSAGKDGGAGKGGGAIDGGAGKAGSAGAVGDSGTTSDTSTPPRPDATADVAPPPPGDGSTDDLIRELVARIKPEEIEPRYRALEAMSMPNRKTKTASYTAATEWVKSWLAMERPGLAVTFDEWSGSRNIEIKIPGTDPAAGVYVIGGHLDSVTASPGMDDDASGSLGVAILANAMSHYVYKSEIRLMLFDGEESGFVGSRHYAEALLAAGCQPDTCMKLFINMDMLGYDPRDTGQIRVRFDAAAPKMVAQQVMGYVAGLTIMEGTGDCHSSDDCGFSENGFTAGELVEPTSNPQWHKVGDICDNMNFKTINKALQLAGAMLATMGGIHGRAP